MVEVINSKVFALDLSCIIIWSEMKASMLVVLLCNTFKTLR